MHVAFADWNEATVRVLNAAGVDVVVPRDQGCCGAITIHAGEMPRGRELAKRNIAAFERSGADVYVINAAGCGSALKEYGELAARGPGLARARDRVLGQGARRAGVRRRAGPAGRRARPAARRSSPTRTPATWRTRSASARRRAACWPRSPASSCARWRSPRCAAAAPESTTCSSPRWRSGCSAARSSASSRSAPEIVATANPGCALQMRNGLDRAGHPAIAVKHVVELLDESLAVAARAV